MDYRKQIYDNYVSLWQNGDSSFDEEASRRWGRAYRFFLRRVLPEDKNAAILDLACGGGKLLYFFTSMGYTNVKGVDISPEQVTLARQVCSDVTLADAVEYLKAHEGEFDFIVGLDIIEHFTKKEVLTFLLAVRNALQENGRVVLQTPNSASLAGAAMQFGDFTHEIGFTPGCLENILRITGFANYEAWELGPAPHGFISTIRFCLWQIIRTGHMVYDFVEVGGQKHPVYTRVFLASAVKNGS
jgi:cyclopropane fatty-acyl-phospholipid synthase-like methyltransferase